MSLDTRSASGAPVCFGGAGTRSADELTWFARQIVCALDRYPLQATLLLACRDRFSLMAGLFAAGLRGDRVLLPPNGQPETIRALLAQGNVHALLHDREGADGLDLAFLERQALACEVGARRSVDARSLLACGPEVVFYTSGSTGSPVAHPKAWAQLVLEAETHVELFALRGCRVVAGAPAHHIYGFLFGVLVPLVAGGCVLRTTPVLPHDVRAACLAHAATVLVSTPPQLSALALDAEVSLPSLQRAFCSAGPLPTGSHAALRARGMAVIEVLGSTETGGVAFRAQTELPWRPLPGVSIAVDEDETLLVDAPWLAPGSARPFRTADRATQVVGGFYHRGRRDAVLKIAGQRVDAAAIEAALSTLPGVRAVWVFPVAATPVRGLTLWAVLETDEELPISVLRGSLSQFDPVTHPRRFRCVRTVPRSETGKVAQSALLGLFEVQNEPSESIAEHTVQVPVPRDIAFVQGHFTGNPILPGVVQLRHVALAATRERYPELGALVRMTRIKFKCVVRPGDSLTLTLQRKGPTQVAFWLQSGAVPACSGIFHFQDRKMAEVSSESALDRSQHEV